MGRKVGWAEGNGVGLGDGSGVGTGALALDISMKQTIAIRIGNNRMVEFVNMFVAT